jgi:L-lactate dehydrogenase complex protein LldE
MRIGLFVPCYVDAFHPEVGIATLELLERFGIEVEYPFNQTCGGQPMLPRRIRGDRSLVRPKFWEIRLYRRPVGQLRAPCALQLRCNWAEFPHRVAYQNNCNALRGIGHASMSELRVERFSKPLDLLRKVRGIEIVQLARPEMRRAGGSTDEVPPHRTGLERSVIMNGIQNDLQPPPEREPQP